METKLFRPLTLDEIMSFCPSRINLGSGCARKLGGSLSDYMYHTFRGKVYDSRHNVIGKIARSN